MTFKYIGNLLKSVQRDDSSYFIGTKRSSVCSMQLNAYNTLSAITKMPTASISIEKRQRNQVWTKIYHTTWYIILSCLQN